ncbi:MAG: Hpt domain-containing protein [Gemmatimonadaceae bacterium]|nr:Hpt domain-containing protein [Gemmatimonadaceae bacterium]
MNDFDPAVLAMLHRVGGDKLVRKMADMFLLNAPVRIERIGAAIASADFADAELASHSLKSSAGQLGLNGLQRICDELENAAKLQDSSRALVLVQTAESELRRGIEKLQAHIQSQ